ncbi:MAG: hypothetical protein JWQ76_5434 [Ramlibacter sp.]|nr:hypothetical protein [Ramlibacter sp.]
MLMHRRRLHRLTTTLLVVLSLLFAQLALANYACPGAVDEAMDMSAMEMAPGEPCQGMEMDQRQPVLCHQHCLDAPQSFDPLEMPAVSLPAVVQILVVPLPLDSATGESSRHADGDQTRPPPDPLFLATLRLRV